MHHQRRSIPYLAEQTKPSALLTWNIVAQAQAAYYAVTGLWPLIHMPSFLKVTGPKTDLWLVKTVGVLITVIGAALAVASRQPSARPETKLLGVGSAVGLTAIDVIYVAKGRIAPIYLLDAVAELGLIAWWIVAGRQR